MTLLRFAGLVTFVVFFISACSQTDRTTTSTTSQATPAVHAASPTPDEFAAVRAIFVKDCAACHGETGVGGTAKVEGKTLKVPSLRSGHSLNHSDDDFTKQIQKGGDGMPAFEKKLSPKEIADIIRFIRKEFQGK